MLPSPSRRYRAGYADARIATLCLSFRMLKYDDALVSCENSFNRIAVPIPEFPKFFTSVIVLCVWIIRVILPSQKLWLSQQFC